jgi:LPS export ABC transporter protein LptC
MYTRTQNVAFSGGVVVKNPKPITLTTESLDWDARRRIIYSDTPVKLEVDTAMILGRDMTLELDKQKIEINGDVQALFD